MGRTAVRSLISLLGAGGGGALGVGAFTLLYRQGFYGMVIPGASVGLGCMLLSHDRSTIRGVLTGIGGLGLSMATECWYFADDRTFSDALKHIPRLGGVEYMMIGLGTAFAFWWGRARSPWLKSSAGLGKSV